MNFGRVLLRTTIGGLFIGHGAQKLFGWFGGGGIEGTSAMFGSIGLRPPRVHAIAAGVAEAGGGAGLALGVLNPLPSAAIIATMLTAMRTVHLKNGPWITQQGWEYNAVLIAAAVAVAEADGDDSRRGGGALALALGIAGAAGAKLFNDAQPAPDESVEQ